MLSCQSRPITHTISEQAQVEGTSTRSVSYEPNVTKTCVRSTFVPLQEIRPLIFHPGGAGRRAGVWAGEWQIFGTATLAESTILHIQEFIQACLRSVQ